MLKPGDLVGPYTLVEEIGRGGFGVVWLARKKSSVADLSFALKIAKNENIDRVAFEHEVTMWVKAGGHPNVLRLIDAEIYDEHFVLVSEYLPEGSLANWLGTFNGRRCLAPRAIHMTIGILAGLDHLHSCEPPILHRDIKPTNILLQAGSPKLADFGIARLIKVGTPSSTIAGTYPYMAPEAFKGKLGKRTVHADLWSVGVVLYEMVSGTLPFPQESHHELIYAITNDDPEPLPNSIPEVIERIVFKALQRRPEDRFGSAVEMSEALRTSLNEVGLEDFKNGYKGSIDKGLAARQEAPTFVDQNSGQSLTIVDNRTGNKYEMPIE